MGSLLQRGPSYIRAQAVRPHTTRVQQRLVLRFEAFCHRQNLSPTDCLSIPPFVCAAFQRYAPSTLFTYTEHLRHAAWRRGFINQDHPNYKDFTAALKVLFGRYKTRKAKPLPWPPPPSLLAALTSHQQWLLSLVYLSALRFGDLSSVKVEDLIQLKNGIAVLLGRTKEDRLNSRPEAHAVCPLPPPRKRSGLLLSAADQKALSLVLKRHGFGLHSPRRGALQSLLLRSEDVSLVQAHARHQRVATTMGYLDHLPLELESRMQPARLLAQASM